MTLCTDLMKSISYSLTYNCSNVLQYDATVVGGHGGGGEYEVQAGFGWTNGVIMELLERYGSQLTAEERFNAVMSASMASDRPYADSGASVLSGVATALLALVATLAAGCIG